LTIPQEELLLRLCESEDFKKLLDEISAAEVKRQKNFIAAALEAGSLSKACLAQGALKVWESEISRAFKREATAILEKQKKGTAHARA
jgi:hypothetical protein